MFISLCVWGIWVVDDLVDFVNCVGGYFFLVLSIVDYVIWFEVVSVV